MIIVGCVDKCGRSANVWESDPPWRCWQCLMDRDIDARHLREHLRALASNLYIASGLCAAFRAGDNFGFHMASEEYGQCICQWSPNVRGEPYRGSTRCDQDDDDYELEPQRCKECREELDLCCCYLEEP